MKLFTLAASIVAATISTSAFAGGLSGAIVETPVAYSGLDLSDRNSGLTKRVMCTNVPAKNGSVAGFFIPTIGYFVEESSAPYAVGNQIAGVIPGHLSSKDAVDVQNYLNSVGLTNFELVIRENPDTAVEQVTILVPVETTASSKQLVEQADQQFEEVTVDVVVNLRNRPAHWCL